MGCLLDFCPRVFRTVPRKYARWQRRKHPIPKTVRQASVSRPSDGWGPTNSAIIWMRQKSLQGKVAVPRCRTARPIRRVREIGEAHQEESEEARLCRIKRLSSQELETQRRKGRRDFIREFPLRSQRLCVSNCPCSRNRNRPSKQTSGAWVMAGEWKRTSLREGSDHLGQMAEGGVYPAVRHEDH